MRSAIGWLMMGTLVAACGPELPSRADETEPTVGSFPGPVEAMPTAAPGLTAPPTVAWESTPEPEMAGVSPSGDGRSAEETGSDADNRTVGFIVHEWGTYTSVQSSLGETMVGMHRSDEPLPSFVHQISREDGAAYKGLLTAPDGVTQRLETPVLYFYTGEVTEVRVDVAFPEGAVTEFYPNVVDLQPEPGADVVVADGRARWEVVVQPGIVPVPAVSPDDIWAPSRAVPEAASVLMGDEAERFIFYRGMGTFDLPVRIGQASLEQMVVANESDDDIARAFLIRVHDQGAAIQDLGPLPAGGTIDVVPGPEELELDAYLAEAQDAFAAALEATGLYPDEARALVETWERSYFLTPGIRVLYLAPRTWTDVLLPIDIEPRPDELVRTLVGRIEVMTSDEELELLARLEAFRRDHVDPAAGLDGDAAWSFVDALGRLAEPKLRRILQLVDNDGVRWVCQTLIELAHVERPL